MTARTDPNLSMLVGLFLQRYPRIDPDNLWSLVQIAYGSGESVGRAEVIAAWEGFHAERKTKEAQETALRG